MVGFFAFGQHHSVVARARQGLEVASLVVGAEWVDAYHGAGGIELNVDKRTPSVFSMAWRYSVFKVEDDDIGCCSGFFEAFGPISRTEQPRRTGVVQTHQSAGLMRTRVWRVAVATTSPCWLRPVCAKVTIPSPGRLLDSRFSVTTVSA